MKHNSYSYKRNRTMGIEVKNDNKVFIKIPLEKGGFWQKEYFQDDLIEDVVRDFKAENHVDIPKDSFLDLNFKNKSLKMTDKIKILLGEEIPTICINQAIKRKPIKINNEENIPDLVGKPFNDPFEVFLFTKEDKTLKIQTYDPTTVNNLHLNNYSPSSAYCNGNNHLFISGGEKKNGQLIDDFWEIDLKEQIIAEPVKIPPKKNHSMIFIPNNYVFVVGGNDKKTFYFNTENAEICEWANLNIIRTEPALQRISNHLYCFDNINKGNNDLFTLEKTNLNSYQPSWTLLTPKLNILNGDEQKLNQKFFGVSKDDEDNIIFLGGNMDNYNETFNYKYNTNLNVVELSQIPYSKYNFKEKTFLHYKNNIDYILPDFNKQHPEVVFFIKKNNKIEVIDYEPKCNSQLKSLNPPTTDLKYDFNMPMIAIPEPINDFNLEDNNIQTKIDKQNIININMNANDPSFQDYNFRNQPGNNDINTQNKNINELQTNFKEPNIEPTKQDLKISLEIQNNMFQNGESTYLRSKEKISPNNNQIINTQFDTTNSNKQQYQLNEIITSDYKINGNIDGIDSKIPKIDEQDINFNIRESKNEDNSISGNIPGTEIKAETTKINNPNINTNIKYNFGSIDFTKDLNLIGTIPGIKSNEKKANSKSKNNQDFYLSGKIDGVKSKEKEKNINVNANKNIKLDLKGPKVNGSDININENASNININKPSTKIELNPPNINIKGENMNNSGNIPSVNINSSNSENTNTKINSIKPKIPDFNISGNIPGRIINPQKNAKSNLNNQSNYSTNNNNTSDAKLRNHKVKKPSLKNESNTQKQKIPDYNLNGNIPGAKSNYPSKIDINKKFEVAGIIEGVKPNLQKQKKNNNIDYNINGNIQGTSIKNKKVDIPSPDIKVNGSNKNNNNSKIQNFYITGKIPGKKSETKNVEIPSNNIQLKEPKLNMPNINASTNSPQINLNDPKFNLKSNNINIKEESKINIPDYEVKCNKISINENNYEDNTDLKIKLPKVDPNLPKINLSSPEYQIKENIADNNGNLSNKIIVPNLGLGALDYNEQRIIKEPKINNSINHIKTNSDININLKGDKILDYKKSGTTKEFTVNKPKINKDIFLTGTILGKKSINNKNKTQSPNNNINMNNPKINVGIKNQNIKINENIQNNNNVIQPKIELSKDNFNMNPPRGDISSGNINIQNPLEAEFALRNTNMQNPQIEMPKNINISGSIPGVKVTKINVNNNRREDFNLSGIIPSTGLNTKNINYKINNPNVQLPKYNTNNSFNNKKFHANIDSQFFSDTDYLKGPRIMKNVSPINQIINIDNPYLQGKNQNIQKGINIMTNNQEILPKGDISLSNSHNIIEKSNIEYYPPEIEYNKNVINNDINNNNYIKEKNFDYKIDNNLENKFNLKACNNTSQKFNDNYVINDDDIHIEIPKGEMNCNINNTSFNITKINLQNQDNNNKLKNKDGNKLPDYRFEAIKEDSKENNNINYKGGNAYPGGHSGTNRDNSKKKIKNLPLVGMKSNSFKTSKVGIGGNLDTENVDVNNLVSANVGVNGIKMGSRIIE